MYGGVGGDASNGVPYLMKSVEWYLTNREWCRHVQDGSYQGERLGINTE